MLFTQGKISKFRNKSSVFRHGNWFVNSHSSPAQNLRQCQLRATVASFIGGKKGVPLYHQFCALSIAAPVVDWCGQSQWPSVTTRQFDSCKTNLGSTSPHLALLSLSYSSEKLNENGYIQSWIKRGLNRLDPKPKQWNCNAGTIVATRQM